MKKWAFFIHFNRINMMRGDPRVWSIHFRGTCYQVRGFRLSVPVTSRYRENGRQPRATLRGMASNIVFTDPTIMEAEII